MDSPTKDEGPEYGLSDSGGSLQLGLDLKTLRLN